MTATAQTSSDNDNSPIVDDPEQRLERGFGTLGRVEQMIEPLLEDMGFRLVRAARLASPGTKQGERLQIMADKAGCHTVSVEDCADISRALAALLDVEDPIADAYTLEVSSSGIDRPLTRLSDFDVFDGFEARVEMQTAYDGQKRFRGVLDGIEGTEVMLVKDGVRLGLEFTDMARAKLIMSDALIKASRDRAGLDA